MTTTHKITPGHQFFERTLDTRICMHHVLRHQYTLNQAAAKSTNRSQGETLTAYVAYFTLKRKLPALHYVGLR